MVQVFRAVDPDGQAWRIEIGDPPDVRVRVFQMDGRVVAGQGIRLSGIGALGQWLVEQGMTTDDLERA